MEKFTMVVTSPIDADDMIAVGSAMDDLRATLDRIGAQVVYARRGDFRDEIEVKFPTEAETAEEQTLNETGEMFTAHGPFTSEEEAAFNAASSNNAPTEPKPNVEPAKNGIGFICKECGARNIMTGTALGTETPAVCAKCRTSQFIRVVAI